MLGLDGTVLAYEVLQLKGSLQGNAHTTGWYANTHGSSVLLIQYCNDLGSFQ